MGNEFKVMQQKHYDAKVAKDEYEKYVWSVLDIELVKEALSKAIEPDDEILSVNTSVSHLGMTIGINVKSFDGSEYYHEDFFSREEMMSFFIK